ncbi:fatty acid synthase-like [Anoplophora glabripennis]|uniref:fatty acid synthase-like n=1 Tax=Anoplophora glabripennis TaxID=217634 RepID=UPI000C772269|nr:fatty acid synthase-like [Anoplophora glabripennis]
MRKNYLARPVYDYKLTKKRTPTGDPQECAAFDNVLTNGRKKPLLIGSIKSNIGHTEPVSGLCSIIKCILAMEVGSIPPNIHFKTPNDEIAGLVEGRLKVVVDETPLEEENALMGINNFGIGGANAQVLLRRNPKKKVQPKDNLPRLACVSGRTEEAVRVLLDEIQTNETDVEYIKLMHEVFSRTIQNHLYRGYVVVSKFGGIIPKSFASCPEGNKPLYLTFGELDDWYEIGMQLMVLPVFQDIIKRLQGTVSTKSTDISNVFLNGQFPGRDCIHVAGAVIVQIALVQLLKVLDVKPSGCFGSSFGVLVSAYCNDILTLDQTIDCAFIINEAILKNDGLQHASTSATQGNQKLRESCEDTVSEERNKCQRKDIIEILLNTFTNESEFLRNDNSKTRIVSADSLVNALTTSRSLGIGSVKPNSVILKIGNFRSNDSEEVPVISLFGVKTEDHLTEFLAGLGSLYVSGCNLQVDRLYPQVDFPVGRGTPMISPFIRWNHSRDKFVPQYHLDHIRRTKHGIRRYKIDLADPQWGLIAGHVVDGRLFFPGTGYLYMVWETFTAMHSTPLDVSRVSIKNCKFIRATTIPAKDVVVFTVSILRGSGKFEVTEGGTTVAAGTISFLPDSEAEIWTDDASPDLARPDLWWNQKDVYKEWRLRGYNFSGKFRSIEKYEFDTSRAYAKWQENWFALIDNMLILKVLQSENRALQVPIFISELKISAKSHLELIMEASEDSETPSSLLISGDRNTGIITCGGITTSGIITSPIKRKKDLWTPVLESYQFVPNYTELDLYKSVRVNTQIIVENTLVRRFKAVEVIDKFSDDDAEPLTPIIKSALKDELLVYPSVKILSVKPLDVDVEIENKGLETENDCVLVIASRIINRPEILNSAFAALKENGYVISRESRSCDIKRDMYPDIAILTVHRTPFETILLLGKQREERTRHFIEINSSEDFSWLTETQASMSSNLQGGVVLYSEDPTSGILGLVNCLRKESGNRNVVCVFATGDGGKFNPNCDQLKKNMAFNVYKNGQWGTFRHLQLEDSNIVESEHCFVNISGRGDLSSLQWTQGPLKYDTTPEPDKELIYVYYSSLNRKDVMTVTGDLNLDTDADPSLGFEFSGREDTVAWAYLRKGELFPICC